MLKTKYDIDRVAFNCLFPQFPRTTYIYKYCKTLKLYTFLQKPSTALNTVILPNFTESDCLRLILFELNQVMMLQDFRVKECCYHETSLIPQSDYSPEP